MTPDLDKYRPTIKPLGMTTQQEDEVIHIIWTMMETIARLAHEGALADPVTDADDEADSTAPGNRLGCCRNVPVAPAREFNRAGLEEHGKESP